jgi:hypothetical protein
MNVNIGGLRRKKRMYLFMSLRPPAEMVGVLFFRMKLEEVLLFG